MFNPNYNSHYKIYANQSLDWLLLDSQKLYEKNLKENYQLLETNNWINKSFTYKFNSHGFRCEEFTNKPTIMFLGCSFTFGVGLPLYDIWPEIISKKLNMHCANLGQPAGANDTAFRLCHGWIDIINPQIICLLNPPGIRLEIIDETYMRLINPARNNIEAYKMFYKDWSRDENNNYFNTLKNNLAIENLCKTRNIKFLIFNNEENSPFKKIDLARDLQHYGVTSNQLFAEHVLSKL